jgi:hypothetical protein
VGFIILLLLLANPASGKRNETMNPDFNVLGHLLYTLAGATCLQLGRVVGDDPGFGLGVGIRFDGEGGGLGVMGDSYIVKLGGRSAAVGISVVGGSFIDLDGSGPPIFLGSALGVRLGPIRGNLGSGFALHHERQLPVYFIGVAIVSRDI